MPSIEKKNQSIPLKFVFKIRGASLSSGKQGQTVEKLRTLSHHLWQNCNVLRSAFFVTGLAGLSAFQGNFYENKLSGIPWFLLIKNTIFGLQPLPFWGCCILRQLYGVIIRTHNLGTICQKEIKLFIGHVWAKAIFVKPGFWGKWPLLRLLWGWGQISWWYLIILR